MVLVPAVRFYGTHHCQGGQDMQETNKRFSRLDDQQVKLVFLHLDEKQRRLVAGLLSKTVEWGGDSVMAQMTGIDRKTIMKGRIEIDEGLKNIPEDRIRSTGAGRPPVEKKR